MGIFEVVPDQAAQDQETLRLLISVGGAVLGSLLVAVAAVVAPLLVQSARHKQESKRTDADRLRDAVVEFVDWSMQEEHYDDAWEHPKSWIQTRRERAFVALETLLHGEAQPVADWLSGAAGDRAYHNPHSKERRFFIHAVLRDLVAWHQGQIAPTDLKPFKMTFSPAKRGFVREPLRAWQQEADSSLEKDPDQVA